MEIYFLRHGIAEELGLESGKKDADRALTPEGVKKTQKAAKGMLSMKLVFDAIVSSPYVRARETAELTAKTLGFSEKIQFSDALIPHAEVKEFIKLIKIYNKNEKILCVGHQPNLGRIVSALLAKSEDLMIDFRKGGLCRVDLSPDLCSGDVKGCATLCWLLTSRQLRGLH